MLLSGSLSRAQEGADRRRPGAEGGAVLLAVPRQDGGPHLWRLPPAHRRARGERHGQAVARGGEFRDRGPRTPEAQVRRQGWEMLRGTCGPRGRLRTQILHGSVASRWRGKQCSRFLDP